MNRYFLPLVALGLLAAILLASEVSAAASPWSGHWETAYVHDDPADIATLDILNLRRLFVVQLRDAIPSDAWDNPDCHGPADAWGVGTLDDPTHMAVTFLWRCQSDGSFHVSVRYLWIAGIDDANPVNDGIVFCSAAIYPGSCGLVWHRTF